MFEGTEVKRLIAKYHVALYKTYDLFQQLKPFYVNGPYRWDFDGNQLWGAEKKYTIRVYYPEVSDE